MPSLYENDYQLHFFRGNAVMDDDRGEHRAPERPVEFDTDEVGAPAGGGRDGRFVQNYLTSETGRVYLMLAHASGRLS